MLKELADEVDAVIGYWFKSLVSGRVMLQNPREKKLEYKSKMMIDDQRNNHAIIHA